MLLTPLSFLMMKLQLISYNVQGMNNPLAPVQLRLYLQDHIRLLDVLCMQEHKLRGQKFNDFGSQVWRDTLFVGCEASSVYNHTASELGAGSGGLGIF
jgi:exonuclease III